MALVATYSINVVFPAIAKAESLLLALRDEILSWPKCLL